MILFNIFSDILNPKCNTYKDGSFEEKIVSIKDNNVIGVFNNYLICLINDKLVMRRGEYHIKDFVDINFKPTDQCVTSGGRLYNVIASYNNQYVFVKNNIPDIFYTDKLPLSQYREKNKYDYLYEITNLIYLASDEKYIYFIDDTKKNIVKRYNAAMVKLPHISNCFLHSTMSKYRADEYLVGDFTMGYIKYLIIYNEKYKGIRWVEDRSIAGIRVINSTTNNKYCITNWLSYTVMDYNSDESKMFVFGSNDNYEHVFYVTEILKYPNEKIEIKKEKTRWNKLYYLQKQNYMGNSYDALYEVQNNWKSKIGEIIYHKGKFKYVKHK